MNNIASPMPVPTFPVSQTGRLLVPASQLTFATMIKDVKLRRGHQGGLNPPDGSEDAGSWTVPTRRALTGRIRTNCGTGETTIPRRSLTVKSWTRQVCGREWAGSMIFTALHTDFRAMVIARRTGFQRAGCDKEAVVIIGEWPAASLREARRTSVVLRTHN
jgi:hypothetical protein